MRGKFGVPGSGFEVRSGEDGTAGVPFRMPPTTPALLSYGLWLIAAGVIAALLLTAAYQVRPDVRIGMGDTPRDAALVRGFNAPERQPAADGGRRFRWTRDTSAIVFPGIGRGAYTVDLTLSGASNPTPDSRVLANGSEVAMVHLTPAFQVYQVGVPAALMRSGSLKLEIDAPAYTPRGDKRTLGVVVQDVTLRPQGRGLVLPPLRIAFSLWVGAMAVAIAVAVAGMSGAGAFAGGMIAAGGMAVFLAWNRLLLTVDAGGVVRAGILMLAVAVAIRFVLGPLCRHVGFVTDLRDLRWLAVIAGTTLALRFAGVLHPSIVIVDLKFHLHRFADVADRHTLLLPIKSNEFGGRTVLYAPTPYVFMLPLSWIIKDRTLVIFLTALIIDGARFCVLWMLARRVTRDLLTANLAVLAMAVMPVGWIMYEWGVYANIFAEGPLMLLFALEAIGYGWLAGPDRRRWCVVFAAVICLTLLGHVGVFVETALAVAVYLVVRVALVFLPRRPPSLEKQGERIAATLFALAGITGALVAFALFYRFPARDILAGRNVQAIDEPASTPATPLAHVYQTGGPAPDERLGLDAIRTKNLAVAIALEIWVTANAFYRVWPAIAAIVGCVLLWRGAHRRGDPVPFPPRDHAASTAFTIAVWLGIAAAMLLVGIVARLYVRYALSILPPVALGTAVALAWLVRRWRWGWCVAAALLAFTAVATLLMWYDRIVYAGKLLV